MQILGVLFVLLGLGKLAEEAMNRAIVNAFGKDPNEGMVVKAPVIGEDVQKALEAQRTAVDEYLLSDQYKREQVAMDAYWKARDEGKSIKEASAIRDNILAGKTTGTATYATMTTLQTSTKG